MPKASGSDAPTVPARPVASVHAAEPEAREREQVPQRFRPVREIARGGMGRVIEAVDQRLSRTVAIKEALASTPDARRRFQREIALTARLEHPSIVPVYDAGESADGEPYYVMRRVSGEPLDKRIQNTTTLDERLALLPNLLAASDAIAHAHARGVIHRDLKPSNILVGELGETVVIDWGLAKRLGEADEPAVNDELPPSAGSSLRTAAGAVFGTPGFMAPEQVNADATDARSDVYALGACLYHLLSGRPPLAGSAESEMLVRTLDGRIEPLVRFAPGLAPDLLTIVRKAMAREMSARYLDAGGFSEDLRRFLAGQLVASHRYPLRQRLARRLRQHRGVVVAVAVALALLATFAVLFVQTILEEKQRAETAAQHERQRADELSVSQASSYLELDPTLAIASLQLLPADTTVWPQVAGLVREARAHGIAYGLPGPAKGVRSVAFPEADSDPRVITAALGEVRLADLVAHTSELLITDDSPHWAIWCGNTVVIGGRGPMVFVDPSTGARATIAHTNGIAPATAADGVLVFGDEMGAVLALDLAGGLPAHAAPVPVPLGFAPDTVQLSPHGTWLVAWGADHAVVARRAGRTAWTVVQTLPGARGDGVFDRAETHFTYGTADGVIALDLATLHAEQRWAITAVRLLDCGELHAVVLGADGAVAVVRLDPGGQLARRTPLETFAGFSLAGGDGWTAILLSARAVSVERGGTRQVVRSPVALTEIAAHGRYLIGIGPGVVTAWDLTATLPSRIPFDAGRRLAVAGPDALVGVGGDNAESPVVRTEVSRAPFGIVSTTTLGTLSFGEEVTVLANGVVAAHDQLAGGVRLLSPQIDLGVPGASWVISLDAATLVVATRDGHLVQVDLPSGARTPLAALSSPVLDLAANHGWIAARTKTGKLWRRDPQGGITTAASSLNGGFAVAADGTVYGMMGRTLFAWATASPSATRVRELPTPVSELHPMGDGRLAVLAEDGGWAVLDPRTGDLGLRLPPSTATALAPDAGLAVSSVEGRLLVAGFMTDESWTLVDHLDVAPGGLAIAPDASAVFAAELHADGKVTVARFELASSPANAAWVRAATNARPPRGTRGLVEWAWPAGGHPR